MKKLCVFLLCLLLSAEVFCQVRVGLLNGPSCIPVAFMMETVYALDGNEIEYTTYPDAMSVVPKIIKNELDITFLPPNVAAKLYASTNKSIICAAVTGEGNLALITKKTDVFTVNDLKGKTVHVAGQGATPEYMFRNIIEKSGVKNVKLDFSVPTSQIAAQLISGKIDYAVVPEPFATIATSKDKSVIYALDLQKEYESVTEPGKKYPLTVMVVRRKFAEENPQVLALFLDNYKSSVEWTVSNPKQAGAYCEKFGLGLTQSVVAASIPKSNFVYVNAFEGQQAVNKLLTIFLENDEASIGGKLPEEDFYLQ